MSNGCDEKTLAARDSCRRGHAGLTTDPDGNGGVRGETPADAAIV